MLQGLLQAAGRPALTGPALRLGEPQADVGRVDRGVGHIEAFAGRNVEIAQRTAFGKWRAGTVDAGQAGLGLAAVGRVDIEEVDPVRCRRIDCGELTDPTEIEALVQIQAVVEVEQGAGQFGDVDQHVVVHVRAVVTGRVGATGADVIGIGVAEDLDQLVTEIGFLSHRVTPQVIDLILVAAHLVGQLVGEVPDVDCILQRAHGAIGDLLELGLVEAVEL